MDTRSAAAVTHASWKEKLMELLQADRKKAWREQREWVLANRNIQTNVKLWERVFAG
jgi:hypothetical protein